MIKRSLTLSVSVLLVLAFILGLGSIPGRVSSAASTVADIIVVPRNYQFTWGTSGQNIDANNGVYCSSNADFWQVLYWRTSDGDANAGVNDWNPNVLVAGEYDIYVYLPDYTHNASITTQAKYYLDGALLATLDQNQNKCQWVLLGRRLFNAGDGQTISMPAQTTDNPYRLIAGDGLKLVYIEPPTSTPTPSATATLTPTSTPTLTPTSTLTPGVSDLIILPRNYWYTLGSSGQGIDTVFCSANPDFTRVLSWRTNDASQNAGVNDWNPNVLVAGEYEIFVYIPVYAHSEGITTQAKYYLDGTLLATLDQNLNQCGWVSIGTHWLNAGDGQTISMPAQTSEDPYRLIAGDGLKLVYVSSTPTPTFTPTPTTTPTMTQTPSGVSPSWTFMLYLAGDTAQIDYGQIYQTLLKMVADLGKGANPNVTVVALLDGPTGNDTTRVTFSPQAQYESVGEKAMDDPLTLVDFVQQARLEFPADYTYLAIADHANGVQGIAWDTTTSSDQSAYLTPSEVRQALLAITQNGAAPIDVLHFDGCSFGMLEDASIAHGTAQYVVASENIGWGIFAYDQYRQVVTANTSPRELAIAVADRYAQTLKSKKTPYTISALDLGSYPTVIDTLNTFADVLTNFANLNLTNRNLLGWVRNQSQKFDSGVTPLEITNEDRYVDLVDFAIRTKSQVDVDGMPGAADNLIEAVTGSQPLVIYESHRSGSFSYNGKSYLWNLDGAYGVSIYYPLNSAGAIYGDYISGVTFPAFAGVSRWPAYLQAGVSPLLPGDPLPGDKPLPLQMLNYGAQIYLPVIRR